MPNRYLRHSYIESERINSVSIEAECVWTRLVVTVDDFGRCEANLRILRPKLFPLRLNSVREADLQRWIAECVKAGLVRLYESGGKRYLQMDKWERGRAEKSKYPAPPESPNKCLPPSADVNICKPPRTDAPDPVSDPDNDTASDTEERARASGAQAQPSGRFSFVKPEVAELALAVQKAGMPVSEADKFFDFYESNGWKVGRNPMRSWKGALGTWKARWEEKRHGPNTTHRRGTHIEAPGEHFVGRNIDHDEQRAAALALHELHRDDEPPSQ